MEITSRRVNEPGGRGRGEIGGECDCGAVERCNGFVGKIVPYEAQVGGDVVVLDCVGVGTGEIEGVVVDLSGRGRFQRNGGAGIAARAARIRNEIILDLSSSMGRGGTLAEGDGAITAEEEVVRNRSTACTTVEMDRGLGGHSDTCDGVERVGCNDPASTTLSVDGGGGGIGKGATVDSAEIGTRLDDDAAIAEIAQSQFRDG